MNREKIVVLSPMDLVPGAKGPKGTVRKAVLYYGKNQDVLIADVEYEDDSRGVFAWPSGQGWSLPEK